MQKIFGISLPITSRGVTNTHKSLISVNEMLTKGWTVVDIVCCGDSSSGNLTGFVVIERDDDYEEREPEKKTELEDVENLDLYEDREPDEKIELEDVENLDLSDV